MLLGMAVLVKIMGGVISRVLYLKIKPLSFI